ncbi:MAG: right-handed parallel beta-helix repeat-containing protein [Phycisphaerae bacterium]|nr:right-handed parallel beta-helix repeat-containing protein [Phycisphaerae bacterium]
MSRWLVPVGLVLFLCTASLQAQESFRRGKIKKIDLEHRILSLAVDGKDEEFQLAEDVRVLGVSGKNLRERLQGIKEGAEIFFRATKRDGRSIIVGLKLVIVSYGATLTPKMPVGAVVVPTEEGALAKAIDSHGTDTVFYLKAGVHIKNGEMRPKAGSVFVGEARAILDGGNTTAKCFIHDVGVIPYAASAPRYVVTLRNLVVRNYCSADQECAVMVHDSGQGWPRALSDPADRNGWLLEHCTFTSNRAGGAYLGSASTARGCLFADNGQIGVKACGRNVRLLACRSTRNNVDRKFNYMWEAGGTKFWGVKDMLVDGGEYDHNGGFGLWFDYVWDGNVVKNASFHRNLRPGLSIEMAAGVEVTGCTFSCDDLDGLSGEIPPAFRPWDKSPKSGPDLWSGEIMLFNACAAGTYVDPATKVSHSFSSKTWIHGNTIIDGGGGILCQYQDRGGINPVKQGQGSKKGPVAGLVGIVIEDNTIACSAGRAATITTLPNRDYKDASGSWGPIPATQAEAQYQGPLFRLNRYSGSVIFRVPKAALTGGSTDIWKWNDRADIDLTQWRSLGKL